MNNLTPNHHPARPGVSTRSMRRRAPTPWFAWWLAAALLCPPLLLAQTNTNAPKAIANRYLLVVETSRAMQKRSEGALKAVQALIATGIGGQAHRGDSIGVWTYNEDLYAGQVPLQTWWPEGLRGIGGKILNYLNDQTFEKSARLDKVLPTLFKVIQDSDYITVILINDGNQKLEGTPFDAQINAAYKSWRSEQQEAHMPFLTVLRAKKGKITDYTVNPAQWPLDMPPLPEELIPVAKAPVAPPQKQPPPIGPSLYLIGKKASTNPPAPVQPAPVQPAPTTAPSTPVATPIPTPGTAPATQAEPASAAAAPNITATLAATPPRSEPAAAPSAPSVKAPEPAPPRPAPDASAKAIPSEPVPAPAAEPVKAVTASQSKHDEQPAAAVPSKSTPSPAPTEAVALPSGGGALRLALIGGTGVVLAACAWLLLKNMKRARAVTHASLITRSLDRTRKE